MALGAIWPDPGPIRGDFKARPTSSHARRASPAAMGPGLREKSTPRGRWHGQRAHPRPHRSPRNSFDRVVGYRPSQTVIAHSGDSNRTGVEPYAGTSSRSARRSQSAQHRLEFESSAPDRGQPEAHPRDLLLTRPLSITDRERTTKSNGPFHHDR